MVIHLTFTVIKKELKLGLEQTRQWYFGIGLYWGAESLPNRVMPCCMRTPLNVHTQWVPITDT